jgi:hypothetical protein
MRQFSSRLTPRNPASYRISIQGHLPGIWRDRIGGMLVSTEVDGQHLVTVLTGQPMDERRYNWLHKPNRAWC